MPKELEDVLGGFVEKVKEQLGLTEVLPVQEIGQGASTRAKKHPLVRRLIPETISVELLLYTLEEFERLKGGA